MLLGTSGASFLPLAGCKSTALFVFGEEEGARQLRRLRSVAFWGRSGLMVKIVFHRRAASFVMSSATAGAESHTSIATGVRSEMLDKRVG